MVKAQITAIVKDAGPITIRLVNRQSKVFYVVGEVNAPGTFPLTGRETVLDAILQAGGLNDKASRTNIVVARPTPPGSCRIVLPVCFKEIVQLGDTTTNYQLAPGDRVFIPAKDFWKDKSPIAQGPNPLCCKDQEACKIPKVKNWIGDAPPFDPKQSEEKQSSPVSQK
jgi:polysaccharide export outer membrane protein